jgi:hypothetical protein
VVNTVHELLAGAHNVLCHGLCRQPDGMTRSSELVLQLCGMDASDHIMELVFGNHLREYSTAGPHPLGRPNSSGLGSAVSNIVRRLAPPLTRTALGPLSSPLRSSVTGSHGMVGGYAPSRAAGSFTSRIQSGFMSLLSSREKPLGSTGTVALTSQQLAHLSGGGPAVHNREGSFSSRGELCIPVPALTNEQHA